jgi:hypothetical protein
MSGTDPYLEWDAAYVLGSLSPAERLEFEEHLAGCEACAAAVAELAGLPGILAQVQPEDAAELLDPQADESRVPDTLLPRLVRSATRRRRRNRGVVAAAVVATAAAAAAVALAIPLVLGSPHPSVTSTVAVPTSVALSPVTPGPLSATVRLVSQKWGTRLEMDCQYEKRLGSWPGAVSYAMYVTDARGASERVATWTAKPGTVAEPSGTTSLGAAEIRTIEVRAVGSDAVLLRGSP